jgi:dihydrofolate reductase
MKLALIVAASENDVIGVGGKLPWHLPDDLSRFKRLTMGHHIIMGRKTFESIGKLLPGRTTVIVTHQPNYRIEGAKIVNSIEQALSAVLGDPCPFVVGGAAIYAAAMPQATDLYLTRVHMQIGGDSLLPPIDWNQWALVHYQRHSRDIRANLAFTFEIYRRRFSAIRQ